MLRRPVFRVAVRPVWEWTMSDLTLDVDEASEIAWGHEQVASQEVSQHRWYTKRLIVFKRGTELFGFYYLDPATEEQEDQERFEDEPVPIFPVIARDVVTTVYEEEPS